MMLLDPESGVLTSTEVVTSSESLLRRNQSAFWVDDVSRAISISLDDSAEDYEDAVLIATRLSEPVQGLDEVLDELGL